MTLAEYLMSQVPEYHDTMCMEGYKDYQILTAIRKKYYRL